MGTTVLSAASIIGRIPDYYFQAVAAAPGIAAWEANLRFDFRRKIRNHLMKLLVSQNEPFTPMYMHGKRVRGKCSR